MVTRYIMRNLVVSDVKTYEGVLAIQNNPVQQSARMFNRSVSLTVIYPARDVKTVRPYVSQFQNILGKYFRSPGPRSESDVTRHRPNQEVVPSSC